MNIRFYNAKMLLPGQGHGFEIKEGELWVKGNQICYIGDGKDLSHVFSGDEIVIWDREIDAKGNLLMPGFKPVMDFDTTHKTIELANRFIVTTPDWVQNLCSLVLIGYACVAGWKWLKKQFVKASVA